MPPSGIQPATFRFVAQYLDHCATISGPRMLCTLLKCLFVKKAGSRLDGWTDGRMDGWTDGRMDGWTVGRMDRWTDGRSTNDHKHFSKLFARSVTINRVLICVSFPKILKSETVLRNLLPVLFLILHLSK
jgi:hypothetical protein